MTTCQICPNVRLTYKSENVFPFEQNRPFEQSFHFEQNHLDLRMKLKTKNLNLLDVAKGLKSPKKVLKVKQQTILNRPTMLKSKTQIMIYDKNCFIQVSKLRYQTNPLNTRL
jgi:hypothetical protein